MSERECVHPLSPWGRIGARRCSARKGVLAAQMVVHGHTPASFHSTAKVQWVKKIQRQWLVRCDSTNLPYSKKIEKNSIFRRFFASRVVLSWIGNHCFFFVLCRFLVQIPGRIALNGDQWFRPIAIKSFRFLFSLCATNVRPLVGQVWMFLKRFEKSWNNEPSLLAVNQHQRLQPWFKVRASVTIIGLNTK